MFTQAVSGLEPGGAGDSARAERGERGRRGGRNRGRGGNRGDAPPVEQASAEPVAGNVAIPDGQDEVGEGSPGADGSRRWRGRRGRRGRTPGAEAATAAAATELPERVSTTGPIADAYGSEPYAADDQNDAEGEDADQFGDDLLEFEAAAETLPTPSEQEAFDARTHAAAGAQRSDRVPQDGRGGRGERNERGGRGGRNRGRGDRDSRGGGQQASPRAPRGFAPSTDLYKVDQGEPRHAAEARYGVEPEIEAPVEPVILPGESLGKYRAGGEIPVASSAAATATPVAPSEFVVAGWDGGFVLPGETLRPRTSAPAYRNEAPQNGRDSRDERGGDSRSRDGRDRNRGGRDDRGDRNRDNRGGRDGRAPRDARPGFERTVPAASPNPAASLSPAEAPKPAETQMPPADSSSSDTVQSTASAFTAVREPEHAPASHPVVAVNSTFVPPPPMPFAGEATTPEPVLLEASSIPETAAREAEPQEYEPSEASASYRVDPAPPSEFRQAAPVLDQPVLDQPVLDQPVLDEPAADEPDSEEIALLPGETAFAGVVSSPADYQHEPVRQEEHAPAAPFDLPAETHELTTISETGNMHSEPPSGSLEELPALEQPHPASPIEHEAAVVDPAPVAHTHQPSFQPGSGLLEEEVLDDDEDGAVIQSVHAHSAADFEQQEHETLEHAADLGSMLREMSIDEITRPEPHLEEEADEDDFEEDFLEEDQDFDSSEVDDDEETGSDEVAHDSAHGGAYAEFETADEREELGEGAEVVREPRAAGDALPADAAREPRREGRSNDRGRRDGRGGRDRNRRPGSGDRERSAGSDHGADRGADRNTERSSGGDRGRRDGGRGRQSMQATNLPAISDLLKPGQEILVQIAKEPIAKKGARITSHIALPGRFLVFMPTVSHTGVSRKIESDGERRRLKEILLSERGEAQGGFIVRTAAAGASEEELRSDLRFLLNLWSDIKTRSESSKSPALIYHDLNLIERVLRDQVTDTFSAIWVDSESEYERVLRFLQRFQPSLIRRVKLYSKETPLFEQFGITEEINKALRSKVWLKSGGSIVINQTEALVAIDINTGKYVGKTARLEDTIVKTNLDAIPEIVRQIRLRDLGGIIIIDFIDMDERKNRNRVMAALEDELKTDRAPSKVLQFNDFGLVAITRKRVKQSLERTLSTTCGVCQGTGMVKSPVTVCNDIYVEMKKMAKHLDRGDVMLRVHPEVVKQLKAPSTHWLQELEEMCGKTILVKSDPSLHPEQFDIH